MSKFPHEPIESTDCMNRMTAKTADRLCERITQLAEEGIGGFTAHPAICVVAFVGPLAKWVITEQDALESLRRMATVGKAGEAGKEWMARMAAAGKKESEKG